MNRHTKRRSLLLLSGALLMQMLAGCGAPADPAPPPDAPPALRAIRWLLVSAPIPLDREWSSYETLRQITEETGLIPQLELLSGHDGDAVIKRLQAGEAIDLITCPLEDSLNVKLRAFPRAHKADDPALLAQIPENVRRFHQDGGGQLAYIPGGFRSGGTRAPAAREGVYVNAALYEAFGSPALRTQKDFLALIRAYVEENRRSGDRFLPVVFGENGSGVSTLEHLFGLSPLMQAGEDVQSRVELTRSLFHTLGTLGVDEASLEMDRTALEHRLGGQVLFYIGPSGVMDRYNMEHQGEYRRVQPVFHEDGFLAAYSDYGSYATYLLGESGRLPDVFRLSSYLLSEEGSCTALLGIRNRHWTNDGDRVVPFPDIQRRLQAQDAEFIRRTGIGLFPYMSSVGAVYPLEPESYAVPVKDILQEIRQCQLDPTSEEGRLYSDRLANVRQSYRNRMALGGAEEKASSR